MSTELHALREAWLALPEPEERVEASARDRLFEEIDRERSNSRAAQFSFSRLARQGHRSRFRLLLAAALALLVLLVGAAFTFGLGLPVLDFGQAEKAPPDSRVVKNFGVLDQGAPPGMATDVIPNETRKVGTLGGETLWVAPTRQGGFCTDLGGAGGCDRLGTVPLSVSWAIERSGPSLQAHDKTLGGLPVVDQINGYVSARWGDALEVRFEDGEVIKPPLLWVSRPIEAGFYLQTIPLRHRQPGHLISAVVALDRYGNLVSSDSLGRDRAHAPPADAILDQAKEAARIETRAGPAVLRTAPTRYEGRCGWLEFAGATHSFGCAFKGYGNEGFAWGFVRAPNDILIFGSAAPNYATIRLGFADGDQTEFRPTKDGFLLYELPLAHLRSGAQLIEVTALNASGETIVREPLSPSAQATLPDSAP
jgi:hypothetical protein